MGPKPQYTRKEPKGPRIIAAKYNTSCVKTDQYPEGDTVEIAFIGRSNVGKSSLINSLCNYRGLALVSGQPGKTKTINYFDVESKEDISETEERRYHWFLVDLPGYGYAKRGKREVEALQKLISYYVLNREQLTCLFVLIDSRLKPQKIDLDFIRFLGENGVPFGIIFTKADKSKRGELKKNVDTFMNTLAEEWEELPPHFITSSDSGLGRDTFLNYIEEINSSFK